MNSKRRCLSVVLFVISIAGCEPVPRDARPADPPRVTVAHPLKKQIVEWDEYVGRLEAIDFVEVRARVSGYLRSIHFQEGQIVDEGDLLFVVDPRPFEAELNGATAKLSEAQSRLGQATAQLGEAKAQHQRTEAQARLDERRVRRATQAGNAVAQEEVDQREVEFLRAKADVEASKARVASAQAAISTATAAVDSAEAAVEMAQLNLDYTYIRAPITGRISKRYITEGNLISGGAAESTLLTTIASIDPIHCTFDASEQDVLKYIRLSHAGARKSSREFKNPVLLALSDEAGFPHIGHMDFVDNRLDPNTATMRARAIFPNPNAVLVPGLFAALRLPGSGSYEAVLIPDSAVGTDQTAQFVFVVDPSGETTRRAVSLGPIVDGLRIVRHGLSGEEQIVIHGMQRVRPGVRAATESGSIETTDDGLPDDYQPIPPEEWLGVTVDPPPESRQTGASHRSPHADGQSSSLPVRAKGEAER